MKNNSKTLATRNPPKNLNHHDVSLFAHEYSKEINATTIDTIKSVDILNQTIFSRYKLKYFEKFTHLYRLSKEQKLKNLKLFLKAYNEVDKGIWIIDNYSIGYFHWLTDALPRLIVCENLIETHSIILPKEYEKEHFIKQSLEMLNLKVDFFDSTKRLHVKELLLPSHTAPTGNYNKVIINQLRDRFPIINYIHTSLKIYISRRKSSKRKIINEDQIIPILKSHGYEIHFFEDYTFYKQVGLMQQATHLIGLHGAGLTNMLFMRKKSKVLELRNARDAHNNCYFSLASDLEHDYYYLLNHGDTVDTHVANITVSPEKLAAVLERMDT